MSRPVDFLVVGGGPAGCAFAILAARAGASVVLTERDDYQQPRPGEHLAGRVRLILDALRVPKGDAGRLLAAPSPGILSLWSDEAQVKLYGATGQAMGLQVLRNRFDELLCQSARTAGATVVPCGRATRIDRRTASTWAVRITRANGQTCEIAAHSIVDATGRSAWVARRQGARRIDHGDLLAIVCWLDIENLPQSAGTMLTIESCVYGWWSLSVVGGTLVATLYTSADMMKSAAARPDAWWAQALAASRRVRRVAHECRSTVRVTRVYRACPSRSSLVVGEGWIAVGDAAIAFDPLSGQGVALALETACRAFEAASADPSGAVLGPDYRDALLSRFDTHLARRTEVYGEAADLPRSFLGSAVIAQHEPGVALPRTPTPAPGPTMRAGHG